MLNFLSTPTLANSAIAEAEPIFARVDKRDPIFARVD